MRLQLAASLVCALSTAACRQTSTQPHGTSHRQITTFNIRSLEMPNLLSVDWDFKFWFLDETPAAMYNDYAATSTAHSGHVSAVLPCLTNASGTGNNQVQATATLHFAGQSAPVVGTGSVVFVCTTSLDTAVDIVISIQLPVNAGFGDLNGQVAVVSCIPPALAWKDDSWLAVCSDSSCGDASSVFLFEDKCSQVGGGAPVFWTCGSPADWTVLQLSTPAPATASATSQFAVPPGAGTWNFGIAALPSVKLSSPDPTLTDAAGNLVVYSNVATPIATLVRSSQGTNSSSVDSTRTAAFAVNLVLPADPASGAMPQQLLQLRIGNGGTTATVWEPFGACDSHVQGIQSWPGLYPIDVRLAGPANAKVIFAASPGGLATQSALCTAVRANDGTPQIACASAGPLS